MRDDFELWYYDEPEIEPGVVSGWVVLWDGSPGPAKSIKATMLVDTDGTQYVDAEGDWTDVVVTAN